MPAKTSIATTVAAAPVATPVPVSAINSTSGNAVAAAGQAQTTSNNTQLSAGTAGGGTGSLAVNNLHSSSVTDTSAANAQTGLSVALAPTVLPGTPAPAGITTASSGNTSATGLQAQNNVANTSGGAVQIGGANQSKVGLTSYSSVDVKDTAASGAASGQAWAVAPGAAGGVVGVATPAATGGAPTSGPVSSTGVTAQNNLSSTLTATMTVPGGQAGATPISLSLSQTANVNVVALAGAVSNPACASAACAPASGGAVPAGTPGAQAASGPASAQGLTAQNTVNTTATVAVKVAGQNFSPIQVIIDSVTHIFNLGIASATSGDSTAGAGAAGGGNAGQAASSGSAKASGGQVQNTVNLGSSASVHVTGDNYNPINIVMNLGANLVNWGAALARSGDAQGTGNGSAAATSGAAEASGMQVMNLINMWADASVTIDGNNYAPIYVHITFTTNIDNRGVAQASTGNVSAGQPSTTTTGGGTGSRAAKTTTTGGSGPSSGSGAVGDSVKAHSGNVFAMSNTVVSNSISDQLSSANGGKPQSSQTITQMLRNLPSGTWDPFIQQNLPADPAPAPQDGLSSVSGDATATGLQSQIDMHNAQIAACRDPGVVCVARNIASLSVVAQDSKTNPATEDPTTGLPGAGGVIAHSADALANVTPTPTPSPKPKGSSNTGSSSSLSSSSFGGGSGSGSNRSRTAGNGGGSARTRLAAELPANGHLVVVDLWDQWPGRRLPPMPNASSHKPTITSVTASIDAWPGADELPLPELSADAPPSPVTAQEALRRRTTAGLHDFSASDAEEFPVMQIADVDPWGPGPDLEALPMPGQPALAIASAASPDNETQLVAPVEPEDAGASPVEFGFAALMAALAGLTGLRRGRLMSVLLKLRSLRIPTWSDGLIGVPGWPAVVNRVSRWPAVFGRQTQRALAIVRLTLGILRLW